jgi:glycosyltransferase involved in cell wall biosynthesis
MKLAFDWAAGSYFGWSVYGLNFALECAKRNIEVTCTNGVQLDKLAVDKVRERVLLPFIRRSNITRPLPPDVTLFHALGNEMLLPKPPQSRIGVVFFEKPLSPEAIDRAKEYDIIIAGSTWNATVLRDYGLPDVRTVIQGVDRSLFHPAPRRGIYPGRFLIFSGGTACPRKGQDIVVKAFRIFAKRHPEAMLVTAWHSPWNFRDGMDLDLSDFRDRVIDVGAVPNGQMAPIYRECHVGVFPNRCEGGTNLVAMECVACGVPIIISSNTGHLDLLRLTDAWKIGHEPATGEPSVDELLAQLQHAFDGHITVRRDNLPGWDATATGLIEAARDVDGLRTAA